MSGPGGPGRGPRSGQVANWPGAREAARRTLLAVAGHGESLARALPRELGEHGSGSERAFAHALVLGVLRFAPRLDEALGRLLEKPLKRRDVEVRVCLLMGLYQLAYLRTPAHAAVSETMRLVPRHLPWARGLVNAVLRRFARESATVLAAVDRDEAARLACPRWLLDALREDWPDDYAAIADAANRQPPLWLRVNRGRGTVDAYRERLAAAGIGARPFKHHRWGLRVEVATDPRGLPGYDEGYFTVQDGAAQLAAPLLAPRPGERVLDACAAPGGKTGHLLEQAPGVEVTALERDPERAQRLHANLDRLRHRARVLVADAARPEEWWNGERFHRVLLDAPCTGTGIVRRHPDIKLLRRAHDIPALAARQAALLRALWPTLAEGGYLLYATCSVLREENGAQVARFLAEQADATEIPIDAAWGRRERTGRQILPGEDDMDGFYYALLRKGA